jgi:3',5'-cyclic-AMP phosphodiesterase
MNILHISDIHFRRAYEQCEDGYKGMLSKMQSPLIPLDYCIKKVKEKEEIDVLMISGDLTEDGEEEDYSFLKQHIENLIGKTKMVVTLGNHDKKANFRKGWLLEKESEKPYNEIHEFEELYVISFDNSVHENPNGIIENDQLIWIKEAFRKTKDKPVILLTHHHLLENQNILPTAVGSDALLEVMKNQNIICILNGHTHHHYMGMAAGKPYFTADSMSFCGEDEENGAVRFEEKYGYNLYQITNGKLTKQKVETFITGKILKTIFMK